jgi:hypothetical protein
MKGCAVRAIPELTLRYDRSFSDRVLADRVLANRIFSNWHLANRSRFSDWLRMGEIGRTGSSHETERRDSNNEEFQHRNLRGG